VEIDIVGDKLGRIHVGNQDLRKLQTRKMRGLKRRAGDEDDEMTKRPRVSGKSVLDVEM
jgi:ribosome production factor 2